jgi:uncharacterized protein DUF6894
MAWLLQEAAMRQVYFHCSHDEKLLVDCCGAEVDGLTGARERAAMVMRSLVAAPGLEDWRNWTMHVSDDLGDEVLALPFSSVVGRLH